MSLVSTKRNVDVLPGQAAPTVFHCSQHDVGATIILGLVNAGGNFSIPSGVTAIIQGSCSNGAVFTPVTATVSGSDITFNLSAEMTSIAGPTVCEAVLSKDTDVLGTANFILDVEPSAMGSDTPPVFTDAAWLWMVNKMGSETVSALGNKTVIDAIESKLDKNQGTANAGKYLKVQSGGQVVPVDLIDNSLLVETMAADSKATGDALNTKLNKNQGANNSGKYLKVGTNGNVETADLDVTTDKTLSIADKAADAKAVGDEITNLKADLNNINSRVDTLESYCEFDVYPIVSITKGHGINAKTGVGNVRAEVSTLKVFDAHFYDKIIAKNDYCFLFYGYDCETTKTWEYTTTSTTMYRGYIINAEGDLSKSLNAYWADALDVAALLKRYPTYYWIIVVKRKDNSGVVTFDDVKNNIAFLKKSESVNALRNDFLRRFGGASGIGNGRLRLYAHRGFNKEAPGNSVPAFELAGKYGFWGIETDLVSTSDGVIVCMHNDTIDATTDGTGAVADLTYNELSQYHIDTGNNVGDYTAEELRIPTLDDYLTICRKYGMVPFIELKNRNHIDTIIDKLKRYGLMNTAIISSSDTNALLETRAKSNLFVHLIDMSTPVYDVRVISYLRNSGRSYNYSNLDNVSTEICENMNMNNLAYCFRAADTVDAVIKQAELGVYYIPTNSVKPSEVLQIT